MSSPNSFALQAREKKALTLARYLYREFLRTVAEMDEDTKLAVAAKAGVNKPSAITWAAVLDVLKDKAPVVTEIIDGQWPDVPE